MPNSGKREWRTRIMNKKQGFTTAVIVAVVIAAVFVFLTSSDPYADLMKKQGLTVMNHPRSALGAGTIFSVVDGQELVKSAPEECFAGIGNSLIPNQILLTDSKQARKLAASVGAKYLPVGLTQIAAAFSFNSIKTLDVSFGQTRADILTVEGFARYLEGKNISKRCFGYLADSKNLVILSAANVSSMTYKFHGDRKVGGNADIDAIKSALKANAALDYSNVTDDSMTIAQPMYIAYQAFRFKDTGLNIPEAGEANILLEKGKFLVEAVSQ
jgi:hypothetical protein